MKKMKIRIKRRNVNDLRRKFQNIIFHNILLKNTKYHPDIRTVSGKYLGRSMCVYTNDGSVLPNQNKRRHASSNSVSGN